MGVVGIMLNYKIFDEIVENNAKKGCKPCSQVFIDILIIPSSIEHV